MEIDASSPSPARPESIMPTLSGCGDVSWYTKLIEKISSEVGTCTVQHQKWVRESSLKE